MWEKSPFTLIDFIKQRKRWIQGVYFAVHERKLSWHVRFFLGIYSYLLVIKYKLFMFQGLDSTHG
jgi:cellulose synthase/poly-beta-1,6-N-acetylglucosamine synthase-like glycosyltransferase